MLATILGGLLVAATESLPAGTVPGAVIAGAVLGGLCGTYIVGPVDTKGVDVDARRDRIVRVDVAGLNDDEIREIERLLSDA